jgi:hypothetical protein
MARVKQRVGRSAWVLTGVPDGGADGVAAAEEELDEPGRYVPRGASDAHDLPRSRRRRGAHSVQSRAPSFRLGGVRAWLENRDEGATAWSGVGFGYLWHKDIGEW